MVSKFTLGFEAAIVGAANGDTPCRSEKSESEVSMSFTEKERKTSRISLGLAPSHKSAKDLYANDTHAIQALKYQELPGAFPMMCYCDPNSASNSKTCRFQPKGHRGRLPLRRKLLWAWPAFGWYALKFHKAGYMKKFYVDDYPRASLGIIAFFSVLSVLVDAFTDPKMANVTDNFKSKYGRRRPFLFASAFFVPLVFVFSWIPIVPSGTAASIWFGIFHVLFKLADTLFLIPFDAWGAQLTPIYKEKTNVWVFREVCANLGILFGMAVLPLLFVSGDECSSTPGTGCIGQPLIVAGFGLLHLHACLQLVYFGKESSLVFDSHALIDDTNRGHTYSDNDTIPFLMSSYLNWPFRCLLLSSIAKAAGQDIPLNMLPFMAQWVIGEKCFASDVFFGMSVLINIVAGVLGMFVWMWISSCVGKYRAYVCVTLAIALTSMTFIVLQPDSGDCRMSYLTLAFCAMWGFAYGGSFLLKDIVSDSIDYDEFLGGGRRREACYLMSIEFIPKFVAIPGECIPFLLMAYAKYQRPLIDAHRPQCGNVATDATLSADEFCTSYYLNEPAHVRWCSDSDPCSSYFDNGVKIICATAVEKCSFEQNSDVQMVLKVCFSIVPAFFVFLSIFALFSYPKNARNERGHEALTEAISKMRQGKKVQDPWQEGVEVWPAGEPGPNFGHLAYFWPKELRRLLEMELAEDGNVNVASLWQRPLILVFLFLVLIPVGSIVVVVGLPDLSEDLGASVSPLGLMVIGIGIVGTWFQGTRVMVGRDLAARSVTRHEVLAKYNQMCPYIGLPRIDPPKPE